MQPAPRQDAILLLQLERHLGVILPQKVHRDHAYPPLGIGRAGDTDMFIPAQPAEESFGQRHLPPVQGIQPHLLQVA